MHMTRREFLQALAIAAASGFPLSRYADAASISGFYDLHDFGSNVTLLHFTDSHAQLLPTYYREPNTNIGVGEGVGKPPHLVGDAFLRYYLISKAAGSRTRIPISTMRARRGRTVPWGATPTSRHW